MRTRPLQACLLESHNHVYLYRGPRRSDTVGSYQLLEMGLDRGSPGVLGAVLLDGPRAAAGGGGGACLVVLLEDSLRCVFADM